MTTQKELLASLRNRKPAAGGEGGDLPPFLKFNGFGSVIQGEVVSTRVTTAYDPNTQSTAKDKNGDDIPQLNVTLNVNGELGVLGMSKDLLWKLNAALEEQGLDELPVGAIMAARKDGYYVTPQGKTTRAHNHSVIVKVPE